MSADLLTGDHHVHSTFSDDAHSTPAGNLTAAAAHGLTTLRMVEHVRAATTWLPGFVRAVRELDPPEGLRVSTGVETKILDERGTLDLPAGDLGVDAVLVADHQFPGPDGPWTPHRTARHLAEGGDPHRLVDRLLDALDRAVANAAQRAAHVQVAHCFSILPKVGLSEADLDDAQLDRWASSLARSGALLEVNEKWRCPAPRALRIARAAGVDLVAATDSHIATDVGRYAWVRRTLAEVPA